MQHPQGLAMTNNVQVLNEADLDLVSGGVRDNPWSDANNQRIAQENGAEGTFAAASATSWLVAARTALWAASPSSGHKPHC
jgi:hypothetical protein